MKHIHKYKRILLGKKDYYVYKCMLEGCTHYLQLQSAIARESLCWGCGKSLFITQENIEKKTVHPICDNCKDYKRAKRLALLTVGGETEEFEEEEYED